MTNRKVRIYGLLRQAVYYLHRGQCYLSGQELSDPVTHDNGHPWEVHHVKHQGTYPHMRFDLDNCVPLSKTVHDLDHRGELVGLIRDKMGDRAFYELNRRANIITSVDLDKVEIILNNIIRKGRLYGIHCKTG